jgi:hypothetical protein
MLFRRLLLAYSLMFLACGDDPETEKTPTERCTGVCEDSIAHDCSTLSSSECASNCEHLALLVSHGGCDSEFDTYLTCLEENANADCTPSGCNSNPTDNCVAAYCSGKDCQ